jgi:shikimate kinase
MNNDCNIILVRGVSGAGKSTIGEMFDDGATTRILSTDDLCMVSY